ncbi:MAG TPA: NAD(P)-binding domain-containing protein, partial [Candidatus Krumholzibacteria bacterium]|nr:NAD(P)-binding domain-containing protein [Candidatus Krumholzibacteria bacterium]
MSLLARYSRWLHTGWPAGTVEKLPAVEPDGSTRIPGLYIVGDLTGIPLLKFSSDTGARAVRTILADAAFQAARKEPTPEGREVLDLVIIGAGVSGIAAALEAKQNGLRFEVCEATEPFSTIVNFPKGKPIYTYPTQMTPAGSLQLHATVKEDLVKELQTYARTAGVTPRPLHIERVVRRGKLLELPLAQGESLLARRVNVAIGRSGNFRRLGVPGEDLAKVANRLHDPMDFTGQEVLVVGGGDSSLEAAIALALGGASVVVSYRGTE